MFQKTQYLNAGNFLQAQLQGLCSAGTDRFCWAMDGVKKVEGHDSSSESEDEKKLNGDYVHFVNAYSEEPKLKEVVGDKQTVSLTKTL